MPFTWTNSIAVGQKFKNTDGAALSSFEKEVKDNLQSIWTSLSLGTISYAYSMAQGNNNDFNDWSEIRAKMDYAHTKNVCSANNNAVNSTYYSSYYTGDDSSDYGSNNSGYNSTYYATTNGTYDSSDYVTNNNGNHYIYMTCGSYHSSAYGGY